MMMMMMKFVATLFPPILYLNQAISKREVEMRLKNFENLLRRSSHFNLRLKSWKKLLTCVERDERKIIFKTFQTCTKILLFLFFFSIR
jgi:hypothetical protein